MKKPNKSHKVLVKKKELQGKSVLEAKLVKETPVTPEDGIVLEVKEDSDTEETGYSRKRVYDSTEC